MPSHFSFAVLFSCTSCVQVLIEKYLLFQWHSHGRSAQFTFPSSWEHFEIDIFGVCTVCVHYWLWIPVWLDIDNTRDELLFVIPRESYEAVGVVSPEYPLVLPTSSVISLLPWPCWSNSTVGGKWGGKQLCSNTCSAWTLGGIGLIPVFLLTAFILVWWM